MPPEQPRASPDALLALAKEEARGHLKIFLGAAPGVGKTYAMLTAARAEIASGREVVVGLVETHGRQETQALLDGLEVLPRKAIVYQNRIMHEFDLDAALAQHTALLLVDELAHTNIPGSRHPKRWQDIEELLDAGINVWTTLNIQHLESLNDVIQKITKVRVRETVPDNVFEDAAEIVLVDFPPDELLKRLAEGKVYVQDTAARAVEGFFKPQNLTALRELTLRRAAERIDTDLIDRMKAQGLEGPWPAGERILACVGPDVSSTAVVRSAKRLADVMDAPWLAVAVERPGGQLSERERQAIDKALKLAESLGAKTRFLVSADLAAEILRFAGQENATQIVVGRAQRRPLLRRRALAEELVRRARGISINIVTQDSDAPAPPEGARAWLRIPASLDLGALVWCAFGVLLAVVIGRAITSVIKFPNVSLVFIVPVLFAATRFGIWPGIFASLLSFAAYNFFFIPPLYTFTVAQPHELLALIVFLIVAVITSALPGQIRTQAQEAVARMRSTRRLYDFTRGLAELSSADQIAESAAQEINESFVRPALIVLEANGEFEVRGAWPPVDTLDAATMTAARWAATRDEPAGAETGTLPTVPWLFLPLKTPRRRVGALGVATGGAVGPLNSEDRTLIEAIAEQIAIAVERTWLISDMVATQTRAETENMRNILLASISHDFRTPLASILGSATSLLDFGGKLGESDRRALLAQIKAEAEGLDEMVRSLLAITRIDAGALELRSDWIDLREIAGRVVNAAVARGAQQMIELRLPSDLPLIKADDTLIEQAIGNAVGNAVQHTPAATRIVIDAAVDPETIALRVTDNGPGIPPGILPHVFDKFVRARASDMDQQKGTGLGLAIAKGIVEAHGATIRAESPVEKGHGTRITFSFPREAP